jgi:hypothetical protein
VSARAAALLALGLVLVYGAGPGGRVRAEVVREEAVGVVPVEEGASPEALRQAALRAGVADAVSRVAAQIAEDEGASADPSVLAGALGQDPFRFAVAYQLLEDRGARPALLLSGEGVSEEYVVVVETQVERTPVRDALSQAGLLGFGTGAGPAGRLPVVLEGVHSYPAYRALRDALGADETHPLEFSRGRIVVEVDTDLAPETLLARARARLPAGLAVERLPFEGRGLRLQVREQGDVGER